MKCTVAKPADPTRTGYTFDGWYTDAACTEGKEFNFDTQLRADTTLYAKWTANKYKVTYTYTYPDGNGGNSETSVSEHYTYGEGHILTKVPGFAQPWIDKGFAFDGWYTNADCTGPKYTAVGETATGNMEYYGRCIDVKAPTIHAFNLDGYKRGKNGWYGHYYSGRDAWLNLSKYNDNNGVDGVSVSILVDGVEEEGKVQGSGNGEYRCYLNQGEHTYQWKLRDAAGNVRLGDKCTYKYNGKNPENGTLTHNAAGIVKDKDGVTWLCGKDEVVLSATAKDESIGLDTVSWIQDDEALSQSLNGANEAKVELKFEKDCKTKIKCVKWENMAANTCQKYATIQYKDGEDPVSTFSPTGIIVEDTPPDIDIRASYIDEENNSHYELVSSGWYDYDKLKNNQLRLVVHLNDTGATGDTQGDAISSGIKRLTWTINGKVVRNFSLSSWDVDTGTYWDDHALTASGTGAGVLNVTITAEDNAGNTASKSVEVKIKGKEMTPAATLDYPNDALSGLVPGALYVITFSDGSNTYGTWADKNGRIPFVHTGEEGGNDDMCGKTVQIKKGGKAVDSVASTPSDPQELTIAARPNAIAEDKIKTQVELAPDAENAKIDLNIEGVTGTKEYSVDGGNTWTDVPSDNVIQNLKAGDVFVRMKATDSAPHSVKTTKNIGASTGTITAVYDLNYPGAPNTILPVEDLKGSSALTKPADPPRDGYDFMGWYMESDCKNEWRFTAADGVEAHKVRDWRKSGTSTTFAPELLSNNVYQITLYAKWRENVNPTLTPKLTTTAAGGGQTVVTNQEGWYPDLALSLDYSDNVAVTKLSVSVDGRTPEELTLSGTQNGTDDKGSTKYTINNVIDIREGNHTYVFTALDAAGNSQETSVTAKLDPQKPSQGTATFKEGYRSFWDWIVRNKTLQIIIPVTETLSGINTGKDTAGVEYVLTPDGGRAQTAKKAAVSGSAENGYTATIDIDPDFKGQITVTATDNAGNVSDPQTIGAAGSGIKGVIVEENAPEIMILADRGTADMSSTKTEDAGIEIDKDNYYNSAPRLYVKVTDVGTDSAGKITSGLKSVTWRSDSIDNGAEHNAGLNFGADIMAEHSFTITALEGLTNTVNITVTAIDQADNKTEKTVTVKIKARETAPAPVINYTSEKLTGLISNGTYKLLDTDGSEKEITADGSGCIKIEEEWFGREVQLCKKGNGSTTLDSVKTDVKPAARPAPPKPVAKQAETVKAKADGIIAASDDASSLDLTTLEYSTDDGASWKPVTELTLTDGKITGCAAGAWLFRVPACDAAPYGETTEVVIGTGKTLKVSFEENGGSEVSEITDLSWHDTVKKPKDPVREGYEFMGWYQEAAFQNIWNFEGGDTVTVMEDDITLHAKWRDNVHPALSAVLISPRSNGSADGGQWYNNLSIALTWSDNTTVTELYVGVDGEPEENYAELNISGAAVAGKAPDGNVLYRLDDNNLTEGEHTYIFKAVDEGGNVTKTEALTARLDTTNPEAGEASYETGHKNLWDWIIKKDSLLITVPVTDMGSDGKAGSGVESVAYRLTPVGADGNAKIEKVSDGKFTATVSVPAEFKGTAKVTAADRAGNTAAEKTLGVSGGGIIVEDNAPKVSFMTGGLAITGDFYENAQDIEVTVDDTGEGITGGIASVQYEMKSEDGNTASYTVEHDYTAGLAESDSFTVPAEVFRPGVNVLTVTAVDNAGNSASVPVTVKIERPEPTPDPKIDYVAERLTGLVANAEYKIADVGMKADEKGSVAIDESWIGTVVSVIRMPGTGENTVSAAKKLDIPDRPEAPQVEIKDETYPNAGDGILTMTETGKVYQFLPDGGTWTDAETDEERRITGLAAKDYYVRARAIENTSFRSKEGTVTVGTTPPTPYNTPVIVIDYEDEKLTGLVPEADYIVEYVENEGDPDKEEVITVIITADKDGNIPVDETWLGKGPLSVVQQGNGKEKSDSEKATLGEGTLPVRPGAPSPSGEDETGIQTGAKLTNLTADTAYDISKDGGKSWLRKTADANGVITGVAAPGTYIVRVAAVGGFKSPDSGKVTVDGYHIPVTFVANSATAGTSWAYYGRAPEKIPAVPKKADAGDKTYVGEWCADESGTPGDLEHITAVTTFYAHYTVGYNVNLKGGAGYSLTAAPGSASPVKEGGSFTLKFTLKSGYRRTAAFAVKVDGVKVALAADDTYTIENISEDHTVTAEGIVAVEKPSGSSGGSDSKDDNDKKDETTPGSTIPGGTDGTNPGGTNPGGTEGTKPGGSNTNPGGTTPDGKYPVTEVPDGKTPGGSDFPENMKLPDDTKLMAGIISVTIEDGRVAVMSGTTGGAGDGTGTGSTGDGSGTGSAAAIPAGNVDGMEANGVILHAADGDGAVVVTVVCEEKTYTAGVADTIAVVNAVLSPEQLQFVKDGETIEILIDVKDITDNIPPQDKEIIGDGMEAGREELPELTLGMYIDISMFMKIGTGDWNTVTHTEDPVDVVIGVPEELKEDGLHHPLPRRGICPPAGYGRRPGYHHSQHKPLLRLCDCI